MKKFFVMLLVLVVSSFASASASVLTFTPNVGGATDVVAPGAGPIAFDISASGAEFLRSTGLLTITVTGDATLDVMTGKASEAGNWNDLFGLNANNATISEREGTIGRTSLSPTSPLWLTLPNQALTGLTLNYGSGTVVVTVTPSSKANAFGNAAYTHQGVAGDDLDAMGGTLTVVPEPMTMSLLGLGGLALIRRRRA